MRGVEPGRHRVQKRQGGGSESGGELAGPPVNQTRFVAVPALGDRQGKRLHGPGEILKEARRKSAVDDDSFGIEEVFANRDLRRQITGGLLASSPNDRVPFSVKALDVRIFGMVDPRSGQPFGEGLDRRIGLQASVLPA